MWKRSLTGPFLGIYAVKTAVLGATFLVLLFMLVQFHDDDRRAHGSTQTLIETITAQQTVSDLDNALRAERRSPTGAHALHVKHLEGKLFTALGNLEKNTFTASERHELDSIAADVGQLVENNVQVPPPAGAGGDAAGPPGIASGNTTTLPPQMELVGQSAPASQRWRRPTRTSARRVGRPC